ncbi:MAG: LCP family protein [Caldilineaceae bacterium]
MKAAPAPAETRVAEAESATAVQSVVQSAVSPPPQNSPADTTEDTTEASTVPVESDGLPLNHTVNILLLGSDRRPGEGNWRTDVLMLLALDLEGKRAAAISFPRDIYLDNIPGHKPNKINVVDFLGERDESGHGPALLASLLTEKIGVPIHYFLRFDFEGFKKVVDALDGVEIEVECRIYEYLPEEDINLYLEPGTHRLAGKMALGYVRARNQGGDLERARRQQRIVWAVRRQLLTENQLANLPALYAALADSVQTDIGFVDAIRLARFGLSLDETAIHGMVISPPDLVKADWRGGMSVWLADWPLIGERVQTVFDRPPLIETNTVGATGDRVQCP